MDAAAAPLIEVEKLEAWYGRRRVLHGIDFVVHPGEIRVIMGGSGSGKSTLLRHLLGLQRPVGGSVKLLGVDLRTASEREMLELHRRIGVSFQGGALLTSLTVGENVALPLREHTNLDPSTIRIMSRLKLEVVNLGGFQDLMPSQLSGGMVKRAALARAIAMDPKLLFFDEPSAGLDPIIAAGIDQLLLKLKEAFGITIIVVTHELASAFLIADRMVLLDKGRIVANGTPAELQASTQPRVRQFLDRVAEPELSQEIDYLQMLTGEVPRPRQ